MKGGLSKEAKSDQLVFRFDSVEAKCYPVKKSIVSFALIRVLYASSADREVGGPVVRNPSIACEKQEFESVVLSFQIRVKLYVPLQVYV